jgi:penicillin-binding protein 2
MTCTGSLKVGRRFRCWKDFGHGSLNIVEAIAYSCDVFFYKLGLELGIERIEKYARMFGLGQSTYMELPGEMAGIVPSAEWKKERFKKASDKKWYDGETLNTAIGQGYLLTTPLQLVRAYATIANDGKLVRPYIIESVLTPDGKSVLFEHKPVVERTLDNAKALSIIEEGLREAVNSRKPFYGTGWRAKNKQVSIFGKTGTAQIVGFKERVETEEDLAKVPYKHRDHSWFVAIVETPEGPMAIVALCEHGGHASESAVPVVREIAKRISEIKAVATASAKTEGNTT